jgi:hypothetical protein
MVVAEREVMTADSDTAPVIANNESELELLKQVQDTMEAAYSGFVLSIREFFEELTQRIDSRCSGTRRSRMVKAVKGESKSLGVRQHKQSFFLEEDWVVRQVAATMQNKLPTGLQEILVAGQLHHPVISAGASLDDMLIWIQTWSHFLVRQHEEELPGNGIPADTTTNARCYRWWAPAVEALEIPVAHIVELSQKCGSRSQGLVFFTLRASPVNEGAGTSSDIATSIHEQEERASASSEMCMVLEGVWLYGAAWNEALGWLEPAATWHPQRVDVVGTIVGPMRGGSDDRSAIPLDSIRPSVALTSPSGEGERSRLQFVPLLSTGPSKCLACWEIRASPALTALMTPYLTTHW